MQVYAPDINYANSNSTAQSLFIAASNCLNGCINTNVQEINDNPESIFVYPNPFSNSVSLQLPFNNCQIIIYDMPGNIVFEKTLYSDQETIYPDLPDGMYFMQVMGDNYIQTIKLEVKK